jgi:putative transposase
MKAVVQHDTPEALTAASRRSGSGRVAHRLLAIRDVLLGHSRTWVCQQYRVSRENLRHWVAWYNKEGIAGLEDAERPGRPPKLNAEQLASLKARVSAPPDIGKDGVGRWRAADVQRLIAREYGVHYSSLAGVCGLLHRLGQAWISGRPKHPRQAADAVASLKKTSRPNFRKSPPRIPEKALNCGARMKPVSGKKAAVPTAGLPKGRVRPCPSIRAMRMPISSAPSAPRATVPSA